MPNGVLNLYSDGLLACSKLVGGNVMGGECAVTYSALDSQDVIVTNYAGTLAGTVTEVAHIEPFSTQTTLHVSGPSECVKTPGSIELESCTYIAEPATVDQNGNQPREGEDSILFAVSPNYEMFTPGIDPRQLLIQSGFFSGPVSFTLERLHGPKGWRCAVRSPSYTGWYVRWFESSKECGTPTNAACRCPPTAITASAPRRSG